MRIIHLLPLPLLATVSVLSAHVGAEPLFDSAPLSDEELGQARGGFNLPNGLKIDFGVLISTRVDGIAVLQTEMRIAGEEMKANIITAAGQRVEIENKVLAAITADKTTQAVIGDVSGQANQEGAQAQVGGISGEASQSGGSIQFGAVQGEATGSGASAQVGSLQLSAGQGSASVQFPSIKVDTSSGNAPAPAPAPAVAPPPLAQQAEASAPPVGQTVVSISDVGVLATAELPDLLVRHAIGREISSMIVNTANGRVVDNEVSINLRMDDVQPFALGSAGYRVQSLGVEAGIWRAVGG